MDSGQLLVLFFLGLIIYASINDQFNEKPSKSKDEEPPAGSGFLYILKRGNHIKVGKTRYWDDTGKIPRSFTVRMSGYIHETILPDYFDVNIVHYDFFENIINEEKKLITYVKTLDKRNSNKFPLKFSFQIPVQDKPIDVATNAELENSEKMLIEHLEKGGTQIEWFEINDKLDTILKDLVIWFKDNKTKNNYRTNILKKTREELHMENKEFRLFISQHPEI